MRDAISLPCSLGLHRGVSAGEGCTGRRRTVTGREPCECPCHAGPAPTHR